MQRTLMCLGSLTFSQWGVLPVWGGVCLEASLTCCMTSARGTISLPLPGCRLCGGCLEASILGRMILHRRLCSKTIPLLTGMMEFCTSGWPPLHLDPQRFLARSMAHTVQNLAEHGVTPFTLPSWRHELSPCWRKGLSEYHVVTLMRLNVQAFAVCSWILWWFSQTFARTQLNGPTGVPRVPCCGDEHCLACTVAIQQSVRPLSDTIMTHENCLACTVAILQSVRPFSVGSDAPPETGEQKPLNPVWAVMHHLATYEPLGKETPLHMHLSHKSHVVRMKIV